MIAADFAFQWQPVPPTLPDRAFWARAAGLLLIWLTLACAARGWRSVAFPLLAIYLNVWVFLTHGLVVARHPGSLAAWLGAAEVGALLLAALALCSNLSSGATWLTSAKRMFGAAPIIFGVAHFAYPQITAGMVPKWIPFPLFWAYATGIIHLGGGLAILVGRRADRAAALLGTTYLSWAVFLHLPRVVGAPRDRVEWTMLFVALALSGAAFLVAWCFRVARSTRDRL